MNFTEVVNQISDLPRAYKRPDTTFQTLIDVFADAVATFTEAADGTINQLNYNFVQWGWLDVWGLILGIARNTNESDATYLPRITETLLAWIGTLPAIQAWGLFFFGSSITVTENSGLGYAITFPSGISNQQISNFLQSLSRIRPIGVPFSAFQQLGSTYLDTIDYTDTYDVTGEYLTAGNVNINLGIPSTTLAAQPLLADYYFTDPTLNPAA